MATIKAIDRIMVEKLKLMSQHRFFASLMLHLKFQEIKPQEIKDSKTNKIRKQHMTMAVDAKGNVYYDPEFVEGLGSEDLKFVLCHELMHVVLRHLYRVPKNVIPDIWNIASDAVINYILAYKENFTISDTQRKLYIMPTKEGILRIKLGNGGAEEIVDIMIQDKPAESIYYEILKALKDHLQKQGKSLQDLVGGGGKGYIRPVGGEGFDDHILQSPSDEEETEENESNGVGRISETDAQDLDRKWSSAIAAANMEEADNKRGSAGGWVSRLLDNFAKPQLNWRALLRKHIKETIPYDCSFKRPKKRTYSTGVYVPIMNFRPHMLTCAIDVSGSISDHELKTFITEIYGITRAYNNIDLRILFWSTKVDKDNDIIYKANKIRNVLGVKAFTTGGTYISCVEKYISENDKKESSIIYLTDGFVEDKPLFSCKNKKRIFIIQKDGSTDILEKYGPTARLKER